MENKHEHYGHRSRLRERVRHEGLEHFQDYQVLEYVLSFVIPYKDTNALAHKLINQFGSFKGVLEADLEELQKVKGMGEASAQFLTTLPAMLNFYSKQSATKDVVLNSPYETFEFFKNIFKGKVNEELYVALLAPNNKLLACVKVREGNSIEIKASPRDISNIILKHKAHNIIVAHNHPKGTAMPSSEDDLFTEGLAMSLALTQVKLLDHIIIGERGDCYSYKQYDKIREYLKSISHLFENKGVAQKFASYGEEDKK